MRTNILCVFVMLCLAKIYAARIPDGVEGLSVEMDVEDTLEEWPPVGGDDPHQKGPHSKRRHHHKRHRDSKEHNNGTFTFPRAEVKAKTNYDELCRQGRIEDSNPVTWHNDECHNCQCVGGAVSCKRQVCPDLPCASPVKVQNECCPMCPEHICQSRDGRWFSNGARWHLDDCTFCECSKGQVLCSVEDCEWKECKNAVKVPGHCCPICPDSSCHEANGLNHTSDSVWKKGECTHCYCAGGKGICAEEKCPYINCSNAFHGSEGDCCQTCPDAVECVVTPWGSWSECPIQECGGGMRRRLRSVVIPPRNGGTFCPHMSEAQQCPILDCDNIPVCPVTEWGRWSHCTATCGNGRKIRHRSKANLTLDDMTSLIDCFDTHFQESMRCYVGTCNISPRSFLADYKEPNMDHCEEYTWSEWSSCSKACGPGVKHRQQIFNTSNHPPHSVPCHHLQEVKPCRGHQCNGCKVTPWSPWTPCSATCGKGAAKSKHRSIIRHPAAGFSCPNLIKTRPCKLKPCTTTTSPPPPATDECTSDDGKTHYAENETWKPDTCTNCQCRNSRKVCEKEDCLTDFKCDDYVTVPGFCCPLCNNIFDAWQEADGQNAGAP